MFVAHHVTNQQHLRRAAATWMPACLLLALAAPLPAQNNFNLKISEKELQLAHPTDMAWMKYNMWDITTERMFDRNTPTLELTNTSTANSLSQLQLTIGDSRFHFADDFFPGNSAIVLGTTTPGFDLSSMISADGNTLTVTVNGGLAPGETVRFRIDLDVDAGLPDPPFYEHPDFRTVLFDINAGGGNQPVEVYDGNLVRNSSVDNAMATATFTGGAAVGPLAFPDRVINGPSDPGCQPCQGMQNLFFNDNFRPYGIMENVDIFEIGGGGPVIPEPATALLALVGLFGHALCRRPRRPHHSP
jgi:hypothetical protein